MPLTVSEIAQLLVDEPERQAALVERIRHWTREGLIEPIGVKNPGTGRHREYGTSALVDVAILNALAGIGMQVGQQSVVLKLVRKLIQDRHGIGQWSEKSKYGGVVYVEISNLGGDKPQVREINAKVGGSFLSSGGTFSGEFQIALINLKINDATLLINMSHIVQNITRNVQRFETRKG
jgi:DNA-binding transcriptional MerR regulator